MGIIVIIIGLALSIGLHEFGHLIPAKLFGVRVPHWAIGFGPKLFSKKIGETEYSFRLIPLGGYITMIGMYPPDSKGKDAKRPFGRLIAQARGAHSEFMQDGDEGTRTLYSLPAWKRIIIMFGGPVTNLIIGMVLLTSVFVSVGSMQSTTSVKNVVPCVAAMTQGKCLADAVPTPAVAAGILAGDKVLAIDGKSVARYAQVQTAIQASRAPIEMTLLRQGETVTVTLPAAWAKLPYIDAKTGQQKTHTARFIGVSFAEKAVPTSFSDSFNQAGSVVSGTFGIIGSFPQQVYNTVERTVLSQQRDPNGAVSIVGVAEASTKVDSFAYWIYLLGSLNIALFVFNMIPLPPLDGGHIAGGVYEYLKRGAFKVLRKKDPGPVDTALMAPIAQLMFIVLFLAGIMVVFADVVNPIVF
jgi:membrane-associated protease RseP (regulator of RpoE activity)